jgi:hypothetical protein
MSCNHDWTIKFRNVNDGDPFEVRPIEMSLKMSRTEYDFCRATLDWEVGEEIKPHTRYENGALYGLVPVDVCYNDDPIQRLMFRPDWVDYGSQETHLQLHDLHKALASGTVDEQRDTVNLEDIYTTIVNSATNRLIDEVEFTVPDATPRTLYGDNAESFRPARVGQQRRAEVEQDQTKRVVESDYAVDFDNISAEKAIQRLNKKFRLKSWVNRKGKLIIGIPEANQFRHVAAPDDDRVWRYKDPSISHGREPVKKVLVEGAWVDEPGFDLDVTEWFDEGGTADVKAYGIAERTDIDYGTNFVVKSTKAKKDGLPEVAILALQERMKRQNSGTVEIDPELSGTEISNPVDITNGDLLQMVPEDDYFENPSATSGQIGDSPDNPDEVCGSFVNNEAYLVTEVEHNVTRNGEWQVHADLGMYPDVEIEAYMTYFDPENNEWVDDSQIADDGSLKGGLVEDIGGWF